MKRISKVLSFLLAALFLCQIAAAATQQEQSVLYDVACERSQEQYQNLMSSFGFEDSLLDIVYPDNYGGAYIDDNGTLVVLSTDDVSSRGNSKIESALSGSYVVDTVEHSYNELIALKEAIDSAYDDFLSEETTYTGHTSDESSVLNSITFFYISQKDNSVVIGISDLSDEKIDEFYNLFGFSSAYMFIEGGKTTTTTSLNPGGSITCPDGGLSIGWPVYFYDDDDTVCKGFVSAGHAFNRGDDATLNGKTIGVCVDSMFSGRNDAALIKITNPNYSMSNNVAISNDTLSSTKYLLVSEGATTYKVGATSGYRTGSVISTNGSVTYSFSNKPSVKISDVLITNAMNLRGDSGCVVYCKNSGNYYAIGSASGSYYVGQDLTESTFKECYVSQMLNAVQSLHCSYLPIS